jgi:hypothetical protein
MKAPIEWRRLEINSGCLTDAPNWRFQLNPISGGYADAQIDDYGLRKGRNRRQSRRSFPWQKGVRLRLCARYSHDEAALLGTAGFGFWNAPFGDPTVRWPALPQAVWFFYASEPTSLPLPLKGPGRGWFASTIDATSWPALGMIPAAPLVLLLNQIPQLRKRIWPVVRRRLNISFAPIFTPMTVWHAYELLWQENGSTFLVDGKRILKTNFSPRGPLGFVCWLDNQYLSLELNGRFRWGTLPIQEKQWLEVADLAIESF